MFQELCRLQTAVLAAHVKNLSILSTNQTGIAGNKTFTDAVGVTGAGGAFNGNGSGLRT
jgi:hypothetical protein